jgi:hypothetical protein
MLAITSEKTDSVEAVAAVLPLSHEWRGAGAGAHAEGGIGVSGDRPTPTSPVAGASIRPAVSVGAAAGAEISEGASRVTMRTGVEMGARAGAGGLTGVSGCADEGGSRSVRSLCSAMAEPRTSFSMPMRSSWEKDGRWEGTWKGEGVEDERGEGDV